MAPRKTNGSSRLTQLQIYEKTTDKLIEIAQKMESHINDLNTARDIFIKLADKERSWFPKLLANAFVQLLVWTVALIIGISILNLNPNLNIKLGPVEISRIDNPAVIPAK